MSQTQVHKAAKLGLGLATELRLGLNKNDVIMKKYEWCEKFDWVPKSDNFQTNKKLFQKLPSQNGKTWPGGPPPHKEKITKSNPRESKKSETKKHF